jgi:hypothetical protein
VQERPRNRLRAGSSCSSPASLPPLANLNVKAFVNTPAPRHFHSWAQAALDESANPASLKDDRNLGGEESPPQPRV